MDALGTLRILEAIKFHSLEKKTKFYQAGTSRCMEKFNQNSKMKNSFLSSKPIWRAKLYAHWITVNYREAYGLFVSNGILFNHESPRRGETFVTKKKLLPHFARLNKKTKKTLFRKLIRQKRLGGMQKITVMLCGKFYNKKA